MDGVRSQDNGHPGGKSSRRPGVVVRLCECVQAVHVNMYTFQCACYTAIQNSKNIFRRIPAWSINVTVNA